MRLTASRSFPRKMKPDAEHQQHDADFGQLRGDVHIGHKARGRRTNDNARDQIADQRRNLQAFGDEAQDQGHAEASGNRGDEGDVVFHAIWRVEANAFGRAGQRRK